MQPPRFNPDQKGRNSIFLLFSSLFIEYFIRNQKRSEHLESKFIVPEYNSTVQIRRQVHSHQFAITQEQFCLQLSKSPFPEASLLIIHFSLAKVPKN